MPSDLVPEHVLLIGLLGGIASGKSFVAQEFARLGAGVLDADRAGHDALRDPEIQTAVRNRWGNHVFTAEGEVDRAALGRIVFAPGERGAAELRYLESLTHPVIGRLVAEQARQMAEKGVPAIVLDAPVMMKAGWDKICDKIVYVDASHDVRLARAKARGWTDDEFRRREATQEALDVKRSRADVVFDNSTSPEAIRTQVATFWQSLFGSPPTKRMSHRS